MDFETVEIWGWHDITAVAPPRCRGSGPGFGEDGANFMPGKPGRADKSGPVGEDTAATKAHGCYNQHPIGGYLRPFSKVFLDLTSVSMPQPLYL